MTLKSEDLLKVPDVKGDVIEGIMIKQLKKVPDERGCIFHMLRCDDPIFENFGEIYFSVVYPGVIKGWPLHEKMTLNYAVIQGMIKLVLYDDRVNSSTRGNLMELFIGEENYCLVKIPPKIWNGFKGIEVVPQLKTERKRKTDNALNLKRRNVFVPKTNCETASIGNKPAIVANCATLAHDPTEIKRMNPFTEKIPYDWEIKHG